MLESGLYNNEQIVQQLRSAPYFCIMSKRTLIRRIKLHNLGSYRYIHTTFEDISDDCASEIEFLLRMQISHKDILELVQKNYYPQMNESKLKRIMHVRNLKSRDAVDPMIVYFLVKDIMDNDGTNQRGCRSVQNQIRALGFKVSRNAVLMAQHAINKPAVDYRRARVLHRLYFSRAFLL